MHVCLIQLAVEDLKIAAAAIDVLFMFHRKLDDEWLIFVGEWSEFVGKSVEAGIL
jgi:hypothetical protein